MRRIAIFIMLLMAGTLANAQGLKGVDFWAGFLINNGDAGTVELTLHAVGETNCTVTVENVITGWRSTVTLFDTPISNVKRATITVPHAAGLIDNASSVGTRGLHITATDSIRLYAMNNRLASGDMATIIPTPYLGTQYMVQDYPGELASGVASVGGAEILFVAAEDSTVLTMTLPCITQPTAMPPGQTLTVTLMRGQTYLLTTSTPNQFSGMMVSSNGKPFALFQGNKIAALVNDIFVSGDHVYEQAVPLNLWGHDFMATPTSGRSYGDKVRILSSANNCVVTIGNNVTCTLHQGETYDYTLPPHNARRIHTSQPASVTLIMPSSTWMAEYGDVSSVTLVPIEYGESVTRFYLPATNRVDNYYINIAVSNDGVSGMTLDGNNISSQFSTANGYRYACIQTTRGPHILSNSICTFTAHAYGQGNVESYAFPLCHSLALRSQDTVTAYDTICLGQGYDSLGLQLPSTGPSDLGTHVYESDLAVGCDLTHYSVYLTVLPSPFVELYDTIVYGDTLTFDGTPLTDEGDHSFSYSMPTGCDSVVIMHLTVLYDTINLYDTICRGSTYNANGFNLPRQTVAGTFSFQQTVAPHFYMLQLTVLPDFNTLVTRSIILGDTLHFADSTFTVAGDYIFHYTAANGCDSTVTLQLSYEAIGLSADREGICPGEPVALYATGTHTYNWHSSPVDHGLDSLQGHNPIIVYPPVTTTYYLVDANGVPQASVTVGTAAAPAPCIEHNRDILDFDNPTLTFRDCSEGRYSTTWTFDDGITFTGERIRRTWDRSVFNYLPDSISVTMRTCNPYNCCADTSISLPLKIRSVWFPNAFTPSEESNNLFGCHTSFEVEDYELFIFNRWGMQLWSTTDPSEGWDGRRTDGTPCPQGAYVYRYYLKATDNTVHSGIGTITLLR